MVVTQWLRGKVKWRGVLVADLWGDVKIGHKGKGCCVASLFDVVDRHCVRVGS